MPFTLYEAILSAMRENEDGRQLSARPSSLASLFSEDSKLSTPGYHSLFSRLRNPAPAVSPGLSQSILKALAAKPKVFVSYHHGGDLRYYEEFSRIFGDSYDLCYDNAVDRLIDSCDSEYVLRRIREEYLTGTSCTIVLCGAQTRWRKFVDWEIKATLDKEHGLIGINLPSNPRDSLGRVHKPDRLQDNIDSGFAIWLEWNDLIAGGATLLRKSLLQARIAPRSIIDNARSLRARNG